MSDPCPLCENTSWIRVDDAGVTRVQRCECWRNRTAGEAMASVHIPSRYRECAFDARSGGRPFDELENPKLAQSARIVERWADRFPAVEGAGLLLSGPPGVGKTHLAVAALRRILVERRIAAPALFCDFRTLLRQIKASYNPDAPATEVEVLQPVLAAEPLVLDELGGESPTLWVFDTLFYILNHRYNEERPTIITTNFSDRVAIDYPKTLSTGSPRRAVGEDTLSERISVRLRSRLYEMCRDVRLEGNDYRMNILQANFQRV